MKKLFLALMLVAAVAMGFTSCKKTTEESTDHTQTFSLGETSYDIDNAITIENIHYDGSATYNAIVLSQGNMIGENGGEGEGIVIVFRGSINAGTYDLTFSLASNPEDFPKYFFADLQVTDIVNFSMEELMQQEGVYMASSGSVTIEKESNTRYTVTTDDVEVRNVKHLDEYETSSVDYEGNVLRYELAEVTEGNLNGTNIVTAGITKYKLGLIEPSIAAFITESGDMFGFLSGLTSGTSFIHGIPAGSYNVSQYPIIYVEGMDIQHPHYATAGDIAVMTNENIYTIDITGAIFPDLEGTYTLHYVGTMPNFDFPF